MMAFFQLDDAIVEQTNERDGVGNILRILALVISLLLLGCGTSKKDAPLASKTAVPAGQTQNEHHRAACLPQEGGGIICQ